MPGSFAELWVAIHATPLAQAIREASYAYPALEWVHIVGLALLFGSIFAYDLRVLGWHRGLPPDRLASSLLPWVWIGFAMNAVSGSLLFISDAIEFAANPALQVKLALIAVAGLNAVAFNWRSSKRPANVAHEPAPLLDRVSAAGSIALWLSIIAAGRMIAYV